MTDRQAAESVIRTDYHMHSTFSPDGHHTPEKMCRQALELHLAEIALTEHAEWHPRSGGDGFARVAAYFESIAHCQARYEPQGLTIHAGVELGNPHQFEKEAMALLSEHPFDVVLASLHWLHGENIHLAECFTGRDPNQVFIDYFRELGLMAMNFDFDILAHFDRILWRATLLGIKVDLPALEADIREAFVAIIRYGRMLELNTTHLGPETDWRQPLVTMLGWYREEGGTEIVVNSDAHRADEIGRHWPVAHQCLLEAGFERPQSPLTVNPNLTKPVISLPATPWTSAGSSRFQVYLG